MAWIALTPYSETEAVLGDDSYVWQVFIAGTTGAVEPDWAGSGTSVVDGSVTWHRTPVWEALTLYPGNYAIQPTSPNTHLYVAEFPGGRSGSTEPIWEIDGDPTEDPVFFAATGLVLSGIGIDSRNNYWVGNTGNREVSMRFTCTSDSPVSRVAVNQRFGTDGAGYSAGGTMTIKCAIQADVSGKPSGTDIASLTWITTNSHTNLEVRDYLDFTTNPSLVIGNVYHLRFTNISASPTVNWLSLNVANQYTTPDFPAIRQPAFPDNDYAILYKQSSGWKKPGETTGQNPDVQEDTPVFDLEYDNGSHDGQGYIGIIDGSQRQITGSSMVREIFTITGGSKSVNTAGFRVMRTSGSGDLTIGLYDDTDTLLVSDTVSSSNFPLVSPPPGQFDGNEWGVITFSPVTLNNGDTYYLRASCAGGTSYYAAPIHQETNWGARLLVGATGAAVNGLGGGGEYTTNGGSTWLDMYEFAGNDAQTYLGTE